MTTKMRVVHYINQFFGGIGGEEEANAPFQTVDGPVGPGNLLNGLLGDEASVVATFICGDNYFVEEDDASAAAAREGLERYKPDVVVAGPAFDAGRYGLAAAQMCILARETGIPAVTAMHPENVGYTTLRRQLVCLPTGNQASEMQEVMGRLAAMALKQGRGDELGPAALEGYLPTGLRRPVVRDKPAWLRAIDLLEDRVAGRPHSSEVLLQQYETVPPPDPVDDMGAVRLGLVTSGGLVPMGNPDRQVSGNAQQAFRYSIDGLDALALGDWESVHGGFNTRYLNTKNPNYVLPLPALRKLQRQGKIGDIYPYVFSTVGNGTSVTNAKKMGAEIAREFQREGVTAALLVAT